MGQFGKAEPQWKEIVSEFAVNRPEGRGGKDWSKAWAKYNLDHGEEAG